jgi:hypothetical protein
LLHPVPCQTPHAALFQLALRTEQDDALAFVAPNGTTLLSAHHAAWRVIALRCDEECLITILL